MILFDYDNLRQRRWCTYCQEPYVTNKKNFAMQSTEGGSWLPFVVRVPTPTESLENTMSAFTPNRRPARFVAPQGG